MTFKRQEFKNETIVIDYNQFIGCKFTDCRFIYYGSQIGGFSNCHFHNVKPWDFGGDAQNTIEFIRATYQGIGEGGKQMMENLFEHIRRKPPTNPIFN